MVKCDCLEANLQTSSPHSGTADGPARETPDIAALTRAMAGGDEAAYRIFYDAYFDRLLRYLLVVTGGNEESAREALQLALVRVVRHVKGFESEEKFWSWLTVLARSALADETRKRRRYFSFLEKFTRHQETSFSAVNNGEADEQLRALLERNLNLLPTEERQSGRTEICVAPVRPRDCRRAADNGKGRGIAAFPRPPKTERRRAGGIEK